MKYQYLEEKNWGFPDWDRPIENLPKLPENDSWSPPVTMSSETVRKWTKRKVGWKPSTEDQKQSSFK